MREIKFRAWNGEKMRQDVSIIAYMDGIAFRPDGEIIAIAHQIDHRPSRAFAQLMQYTGLKDKNDVEIYEGDILENMDGRNIVVWDKFGFWLSDWDEDELYDADFTEREVIGNIYENPELLEDK